jgi:UDP-N-acetyl-D-mannosaminuronate dehydrogenase
VNDLVIVAGLGEVGRPLLRILSRTYKCTGIDVQPVAIDEQCSVLHICYPYQIDNFVRTTTEYIHSLRPALTIIHSSMPPGTTRQIQEIAGDYPVAYSPVRGKHVRMEEEMLHYRKFIAAPQQAVEQAAAKHLSQAGFQTAIMSSPELAELAKLLETTYLGVLIAWTQEMERMAAQYGGTFEDVNSLVEEVKFLPSHIYPGVIGGHCVLPNIHLLRTRMDSSFLDLVLASNQLKTELLSAA